MRTEQSALVDEDELEVAIKVAKLFAENPHLGGNVLIKLTNYETCFLCLPSSHPAVPLWSSYPYRLSLSLTITNPRNSNCRLQEVSRRIRRAQQASGLSKLVIPCLNLFFTFLLSFFRCGQVYTFQQLRMQTLSHPYKIGYCAGSSPVKQTTPARRARSWHGRGIR